MVGGLRQTDPVNTRIRLPDRSPRLFATDLDGTVIQDNGVISDRTVAALARVERAGAVLLFVTGRPPRWLPAVAEVTGHHGLAVCANGALLYDLRTDRIQELALLDPDRIRQIVTVLRAKLPETVFACEYGNELLHETGYRIRWDIGQPNVRVVAEEDFYARPAAKLLVRHDSLDSDTFLRIGRELAGGLAEFTHSSSDGLLEISAAGVSKASALAAFCAERSIESAEVAAVGDMPNDLPMLAWAGTGYAVGNAHHEVLAAVDNHLPGVAEDGVAQLLELLFPE